VRLATLTGMRSSHCVRAPEVACRYWAGRVALRKTARLKIVPQVREKGKRPPARRRAAVARWPAARITLRQGARIVHESGQQ
jgi:hypothetical protein